MVAENKYRVLHCLRAPVGGLFRHVCDLAAAQADRGHAVGIVCAESGDVLTNRKLDAIASLLTLGVHRISMGREVGLGDILATRHVTRLAGSLNTDVLHGHGAKGGAYARLAMLRQPHGDDRMLCFYTPHGGSLHYPPSSMKGRVYMGLERRLEGLTDGLIFESAYSATRFAEQVGRPRVQSHVIPNGVHLSEFQPAHPTPDATDFVFVGELRRLKGVDLLLQALATVKARRPVTATVVGGGPEADEFRKQASDLGISGDVRFTGPLPAREAFTMGRVLVMPSRAESFPYIVLEAGAAALPMIATRVGGIPEIVEATSMPLVEPDNVDALTTALFEAIDAPQILTSRAASLQSRIRATFTVGAMTDRVLSFYDRVAAGRRLVLS